MTKIFMKLTSVICVLAMIIGLTPISFAETVSTDVQGTEIVTESEENTEDKQEVQEDINEDADDAEEPDVTEPAAVPQVTEPAPEQQAAEETEAEDTEEDTDDDADQEEPSKENKKAFKAQEDKVLKITLGSPSYPYEGSQIKPTIVKVEKQDGGIVEPIDYQDHITYGANLNVKDGGTVSIKTTLGGEPYSGTASFTITPADFNKVNIALNTTTFVYNGSAQQPVETITFNGLTLKKGVDYNASYVNNVNAGTATANFTGMGNFSTNSKSAAFTINKANQNLKVSPNPLSVKYGKTKKISVSGNMGKVSYKSAKSSIASVNKSGTVKGKKSGSTTVTVSAAGNNNYNAASVKVKVKVKGIPLNTSKTKIKLSKTKYTYNGEEKKPSVRVYYSGKKLKKNKDYKLTYEDNRDAGKASVIVTGINKYSDKKTKKFTIEKAKNKLKCSISDSHVDIKKTIKITVKKANGPVTFSSSNSSVASVSKTGEIKGKKNGNVTITVKAEGDENYKSATKKFKVSVGTRYITDSVCKVYLSKTKYTYDGEYKRPDVTLKYDGNTLRMGTDYTVSYSDNKYAGRAKIVIQGKGRYAGKRTVYFTIQKAPQNFTIYLPNNHIPYGGKAQVQVQGNYRGSLMYGSWSPSYAEPIGGGWYQGLKMTQNYVTISVTASGDDNYAQTTRTLRVHID
jgi:hypothetical protein